MKILQRIKKKPFKSLGIAIAVIATIIGLYLNITWYLNGLEADRDYQSISQRVGLTVEEPEHSGSSQLSETDASGSVATSKKHDIAELKKINSDCVAWVTVPGTRIDYPVVHTPKEPEYYLRRGLDKEYSDYGTPMLDGRCDINASDMLYIYGHNMWNGSMFTYIIHYKTADFFNSHKEIVLETLNSTREFEIFAVIPTTDYASILFDYTKFVTDEDFETYRKTVKEQSLYSLDRKFGKNDKFITLMTCDVSRTSGRIIVVGVEVEP